MSLYDLIQRADLILKKYEKYDTPAEVKAGNVVDAFSEEYEAVEAEVERLMEIAGDVLLEKNRAIVASKNAEIRKAKLILLNEAILALRKKVKKGKGVTKAIIEHREKKIAEMIDRIYAVPDGMSVTGNFKPYRPGQVNKKGKQEVQLSLMGAGTSATANPLYFEKTKETEEFDEEWRIANRRHIEALLRIEGGLATAKQIAMDMREKLDETDPLINEIDHLINRVTGQLKTNNQKLKGLIEKVGKTRNFCIDIVLICVLLGIGGFIYSEVA